MRAVTRLVAAAVVALVFYACVQRSGALPPAEDSWSVIAGDPADPTHARIDGFVVDERTGVGVEGVKVRLLGAGFTRETTSHADGSFDFPPQAPGTYSMTALVDAPTAPLRVRVLAGERWRARLVVDGGAGFTPHKRRRYRRPYLDG
ncbi:MAG: carboxypeptidase-like regulatory domain-containing protein [Nannocystaceae bacterium]